MALSHTTSAAFRITDEDFSLFCRFLEDSCGIVLASHKQYLVQSRLAKIMSETDCVDLKHLVYRLTTQVEFGLKEKVIDAMTTNETLWFRDTHPFDIFLKQLLPEFAASGTSKIRVWSAACSSGQEPYSLNIVLDEYKRANPGLVLASMDITATDISTQILAKAKSGVYESLAIGRGLSETRQRTYFDSIEGDKWRVKDKIREGIRFQQLNLMGQYQSLGSFDVVFCRNVLIYFSADKKREILSKIHKVLKPGGYLFLGASESMPGMNEQFQMIHCRPGIVYKAI